MKTCVLPQIILLKAGDNHEGDDGDEGDDDDGDDSDDEDVDLITITIMIWYLVTPKFNDILFKASGLSCFNTPAVQIWIVVIGPEIEYLGVI